MPGRSRTHSRRLEQIIDQIRGNLGAEQNAYSFVRELLCDPAFNVGLSSDQVLVDSPIIGTLSRPDIQIWLDVPRSVRNPGDHLFAVMDGKSHTAIKDDGRRAIAKGKIEAYRRPRLQFFWLYDSEVVQRWDLDPEMDLDSIIRNGPDFQEKWTTLKDPEKFDTCFSPVSRETANLATALRTFSEGKIPQRSPVSDHNRHEFIQTVISVARLSSDAVTRLVDEKLIPDLRTARELLNPEEHKYGNALWKDREPEDSEEPISFERASSRETDTKQYDHDYFILIDNLQPFLYALRAEMEILPKLSKRLGKSVDVSFLGRGDDDRSAKEAFIQETATLLLSRMLMIRFAEDFGLLERIISNGGISAFIGYAKYFKKPYQALIAEAYERARPIFRHLFERKALDWILERKSDRFSDSLLHAMWLLARWDFSTVKGDILSGVYDKYLEPKQRKTLGEVYTRPELARYVLEACGYKASLKILDPACGSGTFLVEAFDMARKRAESSGLGLSVEDVLEILPRLNGLDLNEFSATLAKIQILWHAIGCGDAIREKMKEIVRSLSIEGGMDSLETWGYHMHRRDSTGKAISMSMEMDTWSRRGWRISERAFRSRSSDRTYDIVLGNPPYVRVHRFGMSQSLLEEYSEIQHHQTDLSVFFLYRAIKWWLKDGGRLGFFLPLALTEAKYAGKIRELILQYKILEIVDLELAGNKIFHGANIVTCILILEKSPSSDNDPVRITTVDEGCIDKESGMIRMDWARCEILSRKDLLLSKYVPVSEELPETEEEDEGSDSDRPSLNAILTKIKPNDVSILEKISRFPRLESILDRAYRHRTDRSRRVETIPPDEESEWELCSILGYGVKIGGRKLADPDGEPIYKGAHAFPSGVEGNPIGKWNGNKLSVDSRRFYDWDNLIERPRTYAFRNISLGITVSPHPEVGWIQNTVYIVQLDRVFPLNIYILSRIVQWFMVKLYRSSVVQSLWSTWIPRADLSIPIPRKIDEKLIGKLKNIGNRIIRLDDEISRGESILDAYISGDGVHSDPLRNRREILESGTIQHLGGWPSNVDPQEVQLKQDGETIELVYGPGLFSGTTIPADGNGPFRLIVNDPDLLRWIVWFIGLELEDGKLSSEERFRKLPIPKDLQEALNVLDRLTSGAATQEIDSALDELDHLVAEVLGLANEEREYVMSQMRKDPFLSKIQPAWKHTSGRGRSYVVYDQDRRRY